MTDQGGIIGESVSETYFTILGEPPEPPENLAVEHVGTGETEETLYPVDEINSDNVWGSIEYLQHDPESDEAKNDWYESILEGENTELDILLDDPTTEPIDTQTIGVLVRRTDNSDRAPDLDIELWQDGNLIDELIEGLEVEDPNAQIHYLEFNADDLIHQSGEGLELHFSAERSGGAIGDRNAVEYGAVEWIANLAAEDDHNLVTWDASPDDPDEVSHYNIYRSEDKDGPWDEATFVESLEADGSNEYEFLDEDKGMADDVFWWYVVRAVGENDIEEDNEDAVQEPGAPPSPLPPTDPEPEDEAEDVSLNPELSVYVEHEDEENMDVSFYDASDETLIDTHEDVTSGERASIVWSYLEYDTVYEWYAVADDGQETAESNRWSFTTTTEPEPAFFEIEIIHYEEEVIEGDDFFLEYRVTNTGDFEDTQYITITVGEDQLYNEEITLAGKAEHEDEFIHETEKGQAGEYVIEVSSEDDQEEVTVTVLEPAYFEVNIVEYDERVVEGEEIIVDYSVENTGGTTDTQNITFDVNDERIEKEEVTLDDGVDFDGEFVWQTEEGDVGTYDLRVSSKNEFDTVTSTVFQEGIFFVEIDDHSEEVVEGEEIEVTYSVWNTGETEETQTIYFSIDGAVEDSDEVHLDEGEQEEREFRWQTGEGDAGIYNLEVASEDDQDEVSVTVLGLFDLKVNIQGEGSVDVYPERDEYVEGEEVILEARPDEGWHFSEWTGDHAGTEEQITIMMDHDKEVTAVFEEIPAYELVVEIDGEGEVVIEPEREEYEEGTEVTLTAVPDEGWHFHEWTGDHESAEEEITIVMDDHKYLTAQFLRDEFNLTIEIEGEGSTDPSEGTYPYEYEEELSITANPDEGWRFFGWTGDNETIEDSSSDQTTIEILDDYTITAVFKETDLEIISPTEGDVFSDTELTVQWISSNIIYHEIRLEGEDWIYIGESSEHTFRDLEDGEFAVDVRGWYDTDANLYETVNFMVDTTPPEINITNPNEGDVFGEDSLTVMWTSKSDPSPIQEHQLILNGNVVDEDESGERTQYSLSNLGEGKHTLELIAIDVAGNEATESVSFVVDTLSPVLEIAKLEEDVLNEDEITIEWNAEPIGTDIIGYEVRSNQGEWVSADSEVSHSFIGLSDGDHTVEVKVVDEAGNEATESVSFLIDTVPPTLEIEYPDDQMILNSADFTVMWSGEDDFSGIDNYEIRLNEEEWRNVGLDTQYHLSDLSDGEHRIEVRVTDNAGNSHMKSAEFLIDTVPPHIEFIFPQDEEVLEDDSITVKWNGSDTMSGIDYFRIRINEGEWHEVSEYTEYDFTDLSEGIHRIDVRAIDNAGNVGEESISFEVSTEDDFRAISCILPLILAVILIIILVVGWYEWKRREEDKKDVKPSLQKKRSTPSDEEELMTIIKPSAKKSRPRTLQKTSYTEKKDEQITEDTSDKDEDDAVDMDKLEVVEEFQKIKGIGSGIAHKLYKKGFHSKEELKEAEAEDIKAIDGIGTTQAELIYNSIVEDEIEDGKRRRAPKLSEDDLQAHQMGPMVKGKELKKEKDVPDIKESDMKSQQIDSTVFQEKDVPDIKESDMKAREIGSAGFKEKEVDKKKIVEEFTQLKGVGQSKAENLYEHGFRSLDELKDASQEDLQDVKGVGTALSEKIIESLKELED